MTDYINITQLKDITVNTDESGGNLNDEIKDIETANIIFNKVATASEESNNSKVEDKNNIDANDINPCKTNEETII